MVIDTERALMVHRRDHPLSYAFPADEVGDLPGEPVPEAPGYVARSVGRGGHLARGGSQARPLPAEPVPPCRLPPDAATACGWSSHGTTLVDTTDTMIVFETALAPRLYVDPSAVRTDLLATLGHDQLLQLQGLRDVLVGSRSATAVVDDVAWSYDDPLPETLPIKGYFSFDANRRLPTSVRRDYPRYDARHIVRSDHRTLRLRHRRLRLRTFPLLRRHCR